MLIVQAKLRVEAHGESRIAVSEELLRLRRRSARAREVRPEGSAECMEIQVPRLRVLLDLREGEVPVEGSHAGEPALEDELFRLALPEDALEALAGRGRKGDVAPLLRLRPLREDRHDPRVQVELRAPERLELVPPQPAVGREVVNGRVVVRHDGEQRQELLGVKRAPLESRIILGILLDARDGCDGVPVPALGLHEPLEEAVEGRTVEVLRSA
ncbi:MAG TPA: hypothetical protein VHF22_03695 [Planctomycetota bacterium]|nr:hypothetical protein [Planctomycetota bacterium]